MSKTIIFHNPRCSKSRQALTLLEEHGENPVITEYLKTPPSIDELKLIVKQLNITPRELIRKGEAEYAALNLANTNLSDNELLQAMHENPRLIERPIVLKNDKAAVGRPLENILSIL